MNISDVFGPARHRIFRAWRHLVTAIPARRIRAFGDGQGQISGIVVINLDRQPYRWHLLSRELGRFRRHDGHALTEMTRRFSAVDARDGRAVAATADVDATYCVGDQLWVQPDVRLADSFDVDEPVRMTRQEVAVARSHIEVWKEIAAGSHDAVLVLEDDVWFRPGARTAMDNGWRDAVANAVGGQLPQLLYVSYTVADPEAPRTRLTRSVFRATRGLWFLSGYVLSRSGAAALLRAMPVVGPVDLWMNYQLESLDAFALTSPALEQRNDIVSSNSYSILPYLARAGVVDAESEVRFSGQPNTGPVFGWSAGGEQEVLAMALSMLGLRVRSFDGDEPALDSHGLLEVLQTFDALVDAPFTPDAVSLIACNATAFVVVEHGGAVPPELDPATLGSQRAAAIEGGAGGVWGPLCELLGAQVPAEPYPAGVPRTFGVFRDTRTQVRAHAASNANSDAFVEVGVGFHRSQIPAVALSDSSERHGGGGSDITQQASFDLDDTPWVLPATTGWTPQFHASDVLPPSGQRRVYAPMDQMVPAFRALDETFPGSQASFRHDNLHHSVDGVHLRLDLTERGQRPYQSGAITSTDSFAHGRVEATIKPASGPGIITGFFLHRASPRQEVDIEFVGLHPTRMLTNVYFNPGDDGSAYSYGYRGSPCWVDLGFDASAESHTYGIDWRPESISWLVDGTVVHQRMSWDPTPIPHLPMRLHANLWVPRSQTLAGRIEDRRLPVEAIFRDLRVSG